MLRRRNFERVREVKLENKIKAFENCKEIKPEDPNFTVEDARNYFDQIWNQMIQRTIESANMESNNQPETANI